jgi:hypothetical protein
MLEHHSPIIPLQHVTAKSKAWRNPHLETRVLLVTGTNAGGVDPRLLSSNRDCSEIAAVPVRRWFQFCTTGILFHPEIP